MARAAALASLACLALAGVILALLDPEQPWAVAAFIVTVGAAAASFAAWLQLRAASGRRRAQD